MEEEMNVATNTMAILSSLLVKLGQRRSLTNRVDKANDSSGSGTQVCHVDEEEELG